MLNAYAAGGRNGDPVLAETPNRLRIDPVLLFEHARSKRLFAIGLQNRHSGLNDNRSVIELRCHEVHAAAMHFDAGCKCPAVRVQAGKRRQQRRVYVHQAFAIALHELVSKNAHEAREHDKIGPEVIDFCGKRSVE